MGCENCDEFYTLRVPCGGTDGPRQRSASPSSGSFFGVGTGEGEAGTGRTRKGDVTLGMPIRVPSPTRVIGDDARLSVSAEEESAFFTSLHHSDGTTKMTAPDRLRDLNEAIGGCLPTRSPIMALDVGISSGITTAEWLQSITELGYACSMTGVDHLLLARLYRIGRIEILEDGRGHVILIHTGRRCFLPPTLKTGSTRNRAVRSAFRVTDLLIRTGRMMGLGESVRLVSRSLRSRPDVRTVEHNLFESAPEWAGVFDVVRVANVLNRSYFSEPTLRAGLGNVSDWVREGGLLAVARTQEDGSNHGTIFRREPSGFSVVERLGPGSDVERLVELAGP